MVDGEAIAIGICCRSELREEVVRVLNSPLMVFSLFSLIFLIIYVYLYAVFFGLLMLSMWLISTLSYNSS